MINDKPVSSPVSNGELVRLTPGGFFLDRYLTMP
jgi:hypothetical protein